MPVPQQAPVDDDPWGNPMPIQAGPVDPMPAPTEPEVAPKHANHQHRAPRQDAAPQQGQPNADPWSQQFSAPAQPMPQVAAEDDEYSMSDESIGASTALSVDDLTRLFEVKKSRISGRTMQKPAQHAAEEESRRLMAVQSQAKMRNRAKSTNQRNRKHCIIANLMETKER